MPFQNPYALPDNASGVGAAPNQDSGLFGDIYGQDASVNTIKQAKVDPHAFQWGQDPNAANNYNQGMVAQGAHYAQRDENMAGRFANQQAPTIDNQGFNRSAGQAMQSRGEQGAAMGLQKQAAMGNAPSVAQLQMQSGNDAAIRSQQSLASSARGPAALAMAQSQAAGNTAALQQQNVAQQSQLRAGEMAQARGEYAQSANAMSDSAMRQQQLQAQNAQAQAGMQLQQNATNQQGELQATNMGQQNQMASQRIGQQALDLNTQAQMQGQQLESQNYNEAMRQYQNTANQNATRNESTNSGLLGNIIGAGGGIVSALGALSDARAKRDAYDAGADDMMARMGAMYSAPGPAAEKAAHDPYRWGAPSEMMDQLDPYAFKYKPGFGEDPGAQNYGVMAQDLEKSPMGSSLVQDTPQGKMVDTKKATMANMAAATELHDRVKALENSSSPLADKLANDPYQWRQDDDGADDLMARQQAMYRSPSPIGADRFEWGR